MSTASNGQTMDAGAQHHGRRLGRSRRDRSEVSRWLRHAESVGRDVRVTGPVLIRDRGSVIIGDGVVLDGALAPIELVAGPSGRIELGAGVHVGPGASLEAASRVSVGAGAVIGAYAKVLDNNWHETSGDREARPLSQPVAIGAGARVGVRAVMVPGSALGEGSVLDDDSVLSGRVPAAVRVAGVPARLVARPTPGAAPRPIAPDVTTSSPTEAFPQVDGGPGPVSGPMLAWLAGLEELGRIRMPEPVRRGVTKAQLVAAMLNGRRQLRGATVSGRVLAVGSVDVDGPGEVRVGDQTWFMGGPLRSRILAGPGAQVTVDPHVTFNYGVYLRAAERIEIGQGTMFGSRVLILDRLAERSGPVRIGRRVWLAHGVTVLPGVSIGDGCAVSAGAVVDRDIPAGNLAFGSPLRFRPLATIAGAE